MNKKFNGFNEKQREAIARQMGHKGSMDEFDSWVNADPGRAARLDRMNEKARLYVEEPQKYAEGGPVKKKKKGDAPEKPGGKSVAAQVGEQILTNPGQVATLAEPAKTTTSANQIISSQSGQVGAANVATLPKTPAMGQAATNTATATTVKDTSTAKQPTATDANTYDATKVAPGVNNVLDNTQAVQGTVSENAKVEAATALPSANATVQGQLEGLMKQFEGGETPAWAAGAMRMANTAMASRGLGSSSMAGSAITQAAMESAIGIAASDAATFSQFEMTNLNNRQQARLQNAQSFLQMDLANLDVANQTNLFKAQSRIQAMFTDQAADNAAKQFNATSQNQTDQFFAQLKTQTAQFNAAQQNAMKQFNAGAINSNSQFNAAQKNTVGMFNTEQSNSMKQLTYQQSATLSMFNTEQKNARDQFNANNRLIIDQSNAEWRRQIATQDTAQLNETNRLNAQLSTGLTTQAYNNYFQEQRDLMAFAFTAAENAGQRSHEIVLQKMTNDSYSDIADKQGQAALGAAAGGLISSIVDGLWG